MRNLFQPYNIPLLSFLEILWSTEQSDKIEGFFTLNRKDKKIFSASKEEGITESKSTYVRFRFAIII